MKILDKLLVAVTLVTSLQSSMFSMEQPRATTKNDRDLIIWFLNNYRHSNFIAARTTEDTQRIILLANNIMKSKDALDYYADLLKNKYSALKKNKDYIVQIFNEMIQTAMRELEIRHQNVPQQTLPAPVPAPILKPALEIQERVYPALSQEAVDAAREKIQRSKRWLFNLMEAEIKGDLNAYINQRSLSDYVIDSANSALKDDATIAVLKDAFYLTEQQVRDLIKKIRNKVSVVSQEAQKKQEGIKREVSPEIPIVPAQKIVPVIFPEKFQEEIRPNRLYIGLDIKELNTNDEPIRWQTPINGMITRLDDQATFEPTDYFHITMAWYETKNAIDPHVVAKVERALAHATEILKIVFPNGVHEISLLDGALVLGQNAVAFRVAESDDLKKLQDIFLKFLSFENLEGFKFSTFERETPLHVTLGKIWPAKLGQQFQKTISNLSAPDGARKSQRQSFTINTFRLTYSVPGQPWQEKMSYRF